MAESMGKLVKDLNTHVNTHKHNTHTKVRLTNTVIIAIRKITFVRGQKKVPLNDATGPYERAVENTARKYSLVML